MYKGTITIALEGITKDMLEDLLEFKKNHEYQVSLGGYKKLGSIIQLEVLLASDTSIYDIYFNIINLKYDWEIRRIEWEWW